MFNYINQRQLAWAGIYGKVLEQPISFDRLYVNELNDNLCVPLSDNSSNEYKNGDGDELSGNMKALYSSSAFTVNIFEYWKQKFENHFINPFSPSDRNILINNATNEIVPLVNSFNNLFNINIQQIVDITYEKKFIIFQTSHRHPHIDISFECIGDIKDIAFECKYREPFYNINRGIISSDWSKFVQYLDPKKSDAHWEGLNNLKLFTSQKIPFKYLDAVQLSKHILGLNKKHKNNKNKSIGNPPALPGDSQGLTFKGKLKNLLSR
jgi:hypothetical protein